MVNLDLSNLETISPRHLRVLQAVEQGMRNHAFVPLALLARIAALPSLPAFLADLHRLKLVVRRNRAEYALTYLGYDYLALAVLRRRALFEVVGTRVGVGKEADVYVALDQGAGRCYAVKFHKLGLSSFKTAKTKRGYLAGRRSASWMYMSRLSALREFGYLVALHNSGYPCPAPVSLNRHCVVMGFVAGAKMCVLRGLDAAQARELGWAVWGLQAELLRRGVVHGDLNEYNVIVQIKPECVGVRNEEY